LKPPGRSQRDSGLRERAAVMGKESKKDNRAQNKPAMEKVELAKLVSLPASATNRERKDYIKALHDSLLLCKGRHLECAWYIGRELPRLKTKLRLEGKTWQTFCKEVFNIGDRQARSLIKIADHFSSKADLKRLLENADSIRQAVALANEEDEKKQAIRSNGTGDRIPGNPNTGCANRRQPKQNRRGGSAAPETPPLLNDAVRTELRDTGDDLWQLAEIDEMAFGKLRKLIKKQLRIAQGKAAKKNTEDQDKAA